MPFRADTDKAKVLWWDKFGPRVSVGNGMLYVDSLNPEGETAWRMPRGELAKLGWRLIVSAVRGIG